MKTCSGRIWINRAQLAKDGSGWMPIVDSGNLTSHDIPRTCDYRGTCGSGSGNGKIHAQKKVNHGIHGSFPEKCQRHLLQPHSPHFPPNWALSPCVLASPQQSGKFYFPCVQLSLLSAFSSDRYLVADLHIRGAVVSCVVALLTNVVPAEGTTALRRKTARCCMVTSFFLSGSIMVLYTHFWAPLQMVSRSPRPLL